MDATCKHCRKPIVRCGTVPSHAGCASGYGWIHSLPEQWGHSCRPRSDAPYAQPEEAARAAEAAGTYKVEGKDGFDPEAGYYPLSEHPDHGEALEAASARLRELDRSQPSAGGQSGIQDRVYVVHPDGRRERVFS